MQVDLNFILIALIPAGAIVIPVCIKMFKEFKKPLQLIHDLRHEIYDLKADIKRVEEICSINNKQFRELLKFTR